MEIQSSEIYKELSSDPDTNSEATAIGNYQLRKPLNDLVSSISQELDISSISPLELRSSLMHIARLFRMNEMEVAAWYGYLITVITHDIDMHRLSSLLWMAAYQAKSELCRNMDEVTEWLRTCDSEFAAHTAEWFLSCPRFRPLTFRQISASHRLLATLSQQRAILLTTAQERVDSMFAAEQAEEGRQAHSQCRSKRPPRNFKVDVVADFCTAKKRKDFKYLDCRVLPDFGTWSP